MFGMRGITLGSCSTIWCWICEIGLSPLSENADVARQIISGRATAVSSCACVEAQRPASSPPQCKFLQAFQNWILVSCEALEPNESLGSWLKTSTKSRSMSCMWLGSSRPTGHVRDESSWMLTAAEFLLKMTTQCNPKCSWPATIYSAYCNWNWAVSKWIIYAVIYMQDQSSTLQTELQ